MTKEIRHVVTKNRFAWSVDDIILPLLELWLLYYLAHRGYTNLQTDTGLFDQIQDVLLMIIPLTGAGFWIARLWQLNAFTVIETPLNTEENFLFVLDRVKMFHISKREFDRWNFCVGIRDDEREWLWVLARTPAALEHVRDEFPGFWLMRPDR